jgi:thiosulfate/3-mercaptopyruvate sulfurtransferase
MPDYPEEGALRAGHIPTARSIPWGKAVEEGGRFRSREELEELYGFLQPDDKTVVYCRIGERSSHTWFVLTHLLGKPGVRNYDGSWTEWGNTVRVPIVAGSEPGRATGAVPVS